jgi:23S rRNA-/tRNA-specific pseudouridylate synthase
MILSNLAMKSKSTLSSIPRKYKPFKKYCERNMVTLLPHLKQNYLKNVKVRNNDDEDNNSNNKNISNNNDDGNNTMKIHVVQKDNQHLQDIIEKASTIAHGMIHKQTQLLLLDKNKEYYVRLKSKDEDSAFGQLKLLMELENDDIGRKKDRDGDRNGNDNFTTSYGRLNNNHNLGRSENNNKIHVVHRFDCETSDVMTFARNKNIASILSQSWWERNNVSKTYLAKVDRWDPYDKNSECEGII